MELVFGGKGKKKGRVGSEGGGGGGGRERKNEGRKKKVEHEIGREVWRIERHETMADLFSENSESAIFGTS